MERVKPDMLREATTPVLLARVPATQIRKLFPVDFEEIHPLSAPEPSMGALIALENGDLFVAIYEQETETLQIEMPKSKPAAETVRALLREVQLDRPHITWCIDEVLDVVGASMKQRTFATAHAPTLRGRARRGRRGDVPCGRASCADSLR